MIILHLRRPSASSADGILAWVLAGFDQDDSLRCRVTGAAGCEAERSGLSLRRKSGAVGYQGLTIDRFTRGSMGFSQVPQLQKVAGLFDQWASSDRAAQMADGHGHLMQALLADLDSGLTALGTCLDLGCGPGRFLGLAADFGFQDLCGIDASEQMVATARQAVPLADIRVGPFEALPWPEQSFDLVASIEALYYCLQPDLALREVHRVLKPAGRFDLIIDYYAESSGTESWPEGLGFEITRWASSDWQAALEQVGFQVLRSQRIYHPQASEIGKRWTPSVWFPTAQSYARYLKDGALWITAKSG